jgi:hypothetical protein
MRGGLALLATLVLLVMAGCSSGDLIESPSLPDGAAGAQAPEQAVVDYLGAISVAYYSLESSAVAGFVTEEQWVREDAYIELNRVNNEALEMQLVAYSTASPVLSEDSTAATMQTRETWRFRIWDLKTRQPAEEWSRAEYTMSYTLTLADTGWLVAAKDVLESSETTEPVASESR